MKTHYYVRRVHAHATLKHATLATATAESLRLSAKHPGEVFEILQCLGMSQTTTAATFWADGCGLEAEIPWITTNGGAWMPCGAGQKIEIMFRNKTTTTTRFPSQYEWEDHGYRHNIIKWRPVS